MSATGSTERLPNAEGLIKHANCNVLLVEYRGYGTSQGEPTEAGLKADAQGALDHLRGRTDIDTDNPFVFGRSLGGAVAIHLAHSNEGALRGVLAMEWSRASSSGLAAAADPLRPRPRVSSLSSPVLVGAALGLLC